MAETVEVTEDIEVKVASETGLSFVEAFYPALNNPHARTSLTNFYLKPTEACKVDITFNGDVIESPTAAQEIFEKKVEKCLFEAQAFDSQVVNRNYTVGIPEALKKSEKDIKDGKRMSIIVMVTGSVKFFGEDHEGELKGFTDSVLLVPNWEVQGPKANKKGRRWLIQSQTLRITT